MKHLHILDKPAPLRVVRVVRVGIAGSLSGQRVAHAPFFHAARDFLERRGVQALLGDDASTPARALELADEFARGGVRLVVGHFNSDCARAVMPIYRAHGIELLLPASTDVGLETGHGVYRLCADDAAQARAIALWLRERHAQMPAVEVRVDGSAYAERLLASLRAELGSRSVAVLSTAEPGAPRAPICVVLALAHHALSFLQRSHYALAGRTMVFSDEAAVPEFNQAALRSGLACWIVTPDPSYDILLNRACAWVAQWNEQRRSAGSFGSWATGLGHLLPSGQARRAAWLLRPCVHTQAVRDHLLSATHPH
ncbi:MAG: ABC transporter substrate-binding protein [Rhizobacter sp.]